MPHNFKELVTKARTCRRFDAEHAISLHELEDLVDMARISPSATNAQVLRYAIVQDTQVCQEIFSLYVLGGAYKAQERAKAHQVPTGYIIILAPHKLSEWSAMDIGIAAQTIQLAAAEKDLAACMVGSFHGEKLLALLESQGLDVHDKLLPTLKTDENEGISLKVKLLIAIGKPSEKRVIIPVSENGSTMYFREEDVHIVPKRNLDDVIILKV